jgi:hypothetical protein
MATNAPIPAAAVARTLPTEIVAGMGQAAMERVHKRNRWIRDAELRGLIKPATALNLSPFVLNVRQGLINYPIPPAKEGKSFAVKTVRTAITYPKFRGNTEMSDKRIKQEWDVQGILPIEQLLEFKRAYDADLGYEGVSQGGLVVFEGDEQILKNKDAMVMTGSYLQEGLERYLVLTEQKLADLIAVELEMLKNKCLGVVQQCDLWWDEGSNDKTGGRINIQRNERIWHDFGRQKGWIREDRAWRQTHFRVEDSCKKCNQQYVSKTGVCKCGYVMFPLLAYFENEIGVDHQRLNSLSPDEWKKIKAEEERRKAARA